MAFNKFINCIQVPGTRLLCDAADYGLRQQQPRKLETRTHHGPLSDTKRFHASIQKCRTLVLRALVARLLKQLRRR